MTPLEELQDPIFQLNEFHAVVVGELARKAEGIANHHWIVRVRGTVDLFLTRHHGLDLSNSKAMVDALHPRVAIMNNGAHKRGIPAAWQIIHDSPGLEDLWQLHYAVDGGKDHNVPDELIANLGEKDEGSFIQVSAEGNGVFTIVNSRNKYTKTYKK